MPKRKDNRLGPKMLIWDLDVIHSRCVEEGECWLWAGQFSKSGYPVAFIEGAQSALVRRKAVSLSGRETTGLFIVAECGSRACCNPKHLKTVTRKELNGLIWERGDRRPNPLFFRDMLKARGLVKLNEQIAAEIRWGAVALDGKRRAEYITDAAQRHGVGRHAVMKLLRGESWATSAPNSSVFNWRPKEAA